MFKKKVLSKEDKELVGKIVRVNRRPIAEDLLLGKLSDEELNEKYDYYSVQDMRMEIAKLQGNPWVCHTC
jgi:hypothetical protein